MTPDEAHARHFMFYGWSFLPVTKSKSINIECNDCTMINKGTQDVIINGVLLLTPGQSMTFPGYPGEMCYQAFDITFTNDLTTGCNLILVMKEYKIGRP